MYNDLKIIIAGENKEKIDSIRLLLEIEIEAPLMIGGARTLKELGHISSLNSPDILIVLSGFPCSNKKMLSFVSENIPGSRIIFIVDHKRQEISNKDADEIIINGSPDVLDALIQMINQKDNSSVFNGYFNQDQDRRDAGIWQS